MIQRLTQWLNDFSILIRFSVIGTTIIFLLMGAAAAFPQISLGRAIGLTVVAIAFHIYAYVLNDVIDLPVDRTQEDRQDSPLVKGRISVGLALGIALIQIPIMLGVTALLNGPKEAYLWLGVSFTQVTLYNIFGKRNPFPPITDVIQGIGWGELGLYGAFMTLHPLHKLNATVFIFFALYIMLTNGIHGALRDLVNDSRANMRTTSIVLGARPDGAGGLTLTPILQAYAGVLHIALTLTIAVPLYLNWFNYPTVSWTILMIVTTILLILGFILLFRAKQSLVSFTAMYLVGAMHLAVLLAAFLLIFLPYMGGGLLFFVVISFVIPFTTPRLSWKAPWRQALNQSKEPEPETNPPQIQSTGTAASHHNG